MVKGNQRLQPVSGNKSRVAGHEKSSIENIADFKMVEVDLNGSRGNNVLSRHHAVTEVLGGDIIILGNSFFIEKLLNNIHIYLPVIKWISELQW